MCSNVKRTVCGFVEYLCHFDVWKYGNPQIKLTYDYYYISPGTLLILSAIHSPAISLHKPE